MSATPVRSDDLRIERLGGLAGAGLPRARWRSEGRLPLKVLSPEDQAMLDRLFTASASSRGHGHAPDLLRDGLRYRLTRTTAAGTQQVVEVAGEAGLPQALLDCIRDTLD